MVDASLESWQWNGGTGTCFIDNIECSALPRGRTLWSGYTQEYLA